MLPRISNSVLSFLLLVFIQVNSSYKVPPSITEQPEEFTYIQKEQKLELPCMASGNPQPKYTWYKNGVKMDLNSTQYKGKVVQRLGIGTLEFLKPTVDDFGEYQCFAETKGLGISVSNKTQLLLAELGAFQQTKAVIKKPLTGQSLKLQCIPPKGTPTPTINWNILSQSHSSSDAMRPVKFDNRVSMDYNGNLYFANVKEEDYQDGNKYVCSAYSRFLRILSQGFDHIIKPEVVTGGATNEPVSLMWHSETDIKVLKGDDLKMKCIFAGNPTPNVTWLRLNGKIPARRTVKGDSGLELRIKRVQYEDAGEYECVGKNKILERQQTKRFTVKVESRPYWDEEPVDVTKGVEENVTFSCKALGRPEPKVNWFINGEPFEKPADTSVVFKDNTLTYYNLTKKDSKVIQCNASNSNGHIWADFYLNVLVIPPFFVKKVPEFTKVAKDSVVTLICEADGKPTPVISWFRRDQLIKSKRHEILPSGHLRISDVQPTDSGEYTCRARNRFGTNSSTGELAVRTKTMIVEAPEDMVVIAGKIALFTCHATTDSFEFKNLEINWYKDGVLIDLDNPNIKKEPNNNLIISNLSNKDSGNYTCVASNGLDNDTKSAELKVKGPPDPPTDVDVTCHSDRATIFWKEGKNNFSPIQQYIVEFKTSFDSVWHEAGRTDFKVEEWETELSPWSNYTFRVRGVNNQGTGAPSEPASTICTTSPAVPDSHPVNVRTLSSKKKYLVIVWNKMSPLNFNGPGFRYEVTVEKEGIKTLKYDVDGSEPARKEIHTKTVYEPYTISVRARNDLGYALGEPNEIIGYSGEDTPTEAPTGFELNPDHKLTAKSASFRWNPVSTTPDKIKGVFKGYRILFWKRGHKETSLKKIDIQKDETGRRRRSTKKIEATVNLPAFSELSLSVVARNTYYEGPESNVIDVNTPEGVPGRVRSFTALIRGSGHFHLKWEPPEKKNGILIGYDIGFQKINGLKLSPMKYESEQIRDPTSTQHMLRGLDHSTNYRVHIWPVTRAGRGEGYFIDVWTTDAGMPIVPNWDIIAMGNNSLNVTWEIDYNKTNQHVALMHVVEYRKLGESDSQKTPPQIINRWQNVSNLSAGITYEIRVVAKSGNYQAASNWKKVTLPSLPPPVHTISKGTATQDLTSATWFIAMMVAIALLILILIIVCIAKRNREAKYDVQEEERLRGHDPYGNDDHFNDSKNDENGVGKPGALVNGDKTSGVSDSDSLGDYGDVDPSKFNEDGSFIGQYGPSDKKDVSETAAPSAMSTFV
ncbi:NRCAM [Acanthosepion pharaonis]|uniref:NRCAM n=1 Tax=Acanthosepion pharaonis TaxID=158019 RepID=A0A812EW54_ACAPH|nr:NRCAM [Sepia pharaonis]